MQRKGNILRTIWKKGLDWLFPALLLLMLIYSPARVFIAGNMQRLLMTIGLFRADGATTESTYEDGLLLMDEDGTTISLNSIDKPYAFINIWATWCPPCVAEIPSISSLQRDIPQDSCAFIMISQDDDFQKALNFMERKAPNLPVFRQASRLPSFMSGNSIPRSYVVDIQNQKVIYTNNGLANYNTKAIRQLIGGK